MTEHWSKRFDGYTESSWEFDEKGLTISVKRGMTSDSDGICYLNEQFAGNDGDSMMANAKLIELAPKLLERVLELEKAAENLMLGIEMENPVAISIYGCKMQRILEKDWLNGEAERRG